MIDDAIVNSHIKRIEDALSRAEHFSVRDFGSSKQKFALEMRIALTDCLDLISTMETLWEDEIEDLEYARKRAEDLLTEKDKLFRKISSIAHDGQNLGEW